MDRVTGIRKGEVVDGRKGVLRWEREAIDENKKTSAKRKERVGEERVRRREEEMRL